MSVRLSGQVERAKAHKRIPATAERRTPFAIWTVRPSVEYQLGPNLAVVRISLTEGTHLDRERVRTVIDARTSIAAAAAAAARIVAVKVHDVDNEGTVSGRKETTRREK